MDLLKKAYRFWSFAMILAFLFSMSSCLETEGYSLGDFRVAMATVHVEEGRTFSLILDNGKHLRPAMSNVYYKPKEGQRVFVNFTLLTGEKEGYDHFIRINDISNILTKGAIVLNAANADSIGNDPVIVKEMWVGGDFLNVYFLFNYGGERPHAINLVKNELPSETSPDVIDLEFRHNAYNSTASRLYEGFVCFDLKPFQTDDANSVKFSIKVKEWNEEKTYDITYEYNRQVTDDETAEHSFVTPITSSDEYY